MKAGAAVMEGEEMGVAAVLAAGLGGDRLG